VQNGKGRLISAMFFFVKIRYVERQNGKWQNVKRQNVKCQNVEWQNIKRQNVEWQNGKWQNIERQNVEWQNVEIKIVHVNMKMKPHKWPYIKLT
jgi:hypothetical protein